jgi:hypothetical protein
MNPANDLDHNPIPHQRISEQNGKGQMNFKSKYAIFIVVSLLPLCATRSQSTPVKSETAMHKYLLSVVDLAGKPIAEARVKYRIKDRDSILLKQDSAFTDSLGQFGISAQATLDPRYQLYISYRTTLDFTVSKSLYYEKSGRLSSNYYEGNNSGKPTVYSKITLTTPADYFDINFLKIPSEAVFRQKVLSLVNPNIIDESLDGTALLYHSIWISSFKGKRYAHFEFENDNVYNSLKSNKYDIGKKMFDDVIRKALTPINERLNDRSLFYGYELQVRSYIKDFSDEDASNTGIQYRFLIPGNIAKKYKDADISGQQVLDSSVIFMDDERIDLKLQ